MTKKSGSSKASLPVTALTLHGTPLHEQIMGLPLIGMGVRLPVEVIAADEGGYLLRVTDADKAVFDLSQRFDSEEEAGRYVEAVTDLVIERTSENSRDRLAEIRADDVVVASGKYDQMADVYRRLVGLDFLPQKGRDRFEVARNSFVEFRQQFAALRGLTEPPSGRITLHETGLQRDPILNVVVRTEPNQAGAWYDRYFSPEGYELKRAGGSDGYGWYDPSTQGEVVHKGEGPDITRDLLLKAGEMKAGQVFVQTAQGPRGFDRVVRLGRGWLLEYSPDEPEVKALIQYEAPYELQDGVSADRRGAGMKGLFVADILGRDSSYGPRVYCQTDVTLAGVGNRPYRYLKFFEHEAKFPPSLKAFPLTAKAYEDGREVVISGYDASKGVYLIENDTGTQEILQRKLFAHYEIPEVEARRQTLLEGLSRDLVVLPSEHSVLRSKFKSLGIELPPPVSPGGAAAENPEP